MHGSTNTAVRGRKRAKFQRKTGREPEMQASGGGRFGRSCPSTLVRFIDRVVEPAISLL